RKAAPNAASTHTIAVPTSRTTEMLCPAAGCMTQSGQMTERLDPEAAEIEPGSTEVDRGTPELERSAELIERLLGDPELRRRFRADPAAVLAEHGLPGLAAGLG